MSRGWSLGVGLSLVLLGACAEPPKAPPPPPRMTAVELNAFEVRDDDVDRFEHCPPAGDIGQDWVPPLPDWHAPPAPAQPEPASPDAPAESKIPASLATLTTEAELQTRAGLRHCYHDGLMVDPTQDGHVALVLRVGPTGKVAQVESWGACDLAHRALVCMLDEARHVHLSPPEGGSATVTLPAVFTQGAERQERPNDGYAASAYVAVESVRADLHKCTREARAARETPFAKADFIIDVDAQGHGVHVDVQSWKGAQPMLACAAEALQKAPFAPPPAGRGRVIAPIVFNPRPGTE